jgi:hypothetical protein
LPLAVARTQFAVFTMEGFLAQTAENMH